MHPTLRSLFVVSCAGILWGQTMVDLRTQSKSIDFSGANTTKPFKSGTALPSICAVGEMFYKLDAAAGANLYGCTSVNAWTLEQGGGGSGLPSVSGNNGRVLGTDGTTAFWSALGGDISGSASSVTVTQIQNRPVSAAAPGSGQALAWNASTNRWEPSTIGTTGGGTGSGASMASQLGDFAVTRTSASTLNIGTNCSISTPCAVRFGALVFSFPNGATVSVTAGTGVAYIYISSSGALTVGHNLTASCTAGCVAQAGVTSFPPDAIPLFTWSSTNGSWDLTGGTDWRAFLSSKSIVPGSGLSSVESSGKTILSVDPIFAGQRTSPPATSSSACVPGSWATDSSFYYVCVSQNSWRRVGISLW